MVDLGCIAVAFLARFMGAIYCFGGNVDLTALPLGPFMERKFTKVQDWLGVVVVYSTE